MFANEMSKNGEISSHSSWPELNVRRKRVASNRTSEQQLWTISREKKVQQTNQGIHTWRSSSMNRHGVWDNRVSHTYTRALQTEVVGKKTTYVKQLGKMEFRWQEKSLPEEIEKCQFTRTPWLMELQQIFFFLIVTPVRVTNNQCFLNSRTRCVYTSNRV